MAIRDQQKVRRSAVAGTFYEGDALILRRRMAEAEGRLPPLDPNAPAVKAAVLPHAGYIFSLQTAMAAFAPLRKKKFARVIVLGPSHYVGFRGVATSTFNCWRTPFGDLSTAAELADAMANWNSPLVVCNDDAHTREHSLEVQFPLIQYFLGTPEILPLVVSSLSLSDMDTLAPLFASLDTPETLWLVSSDFTHYGPRFHYEPFHDNVRERLHELDHKAAALVADRDRVGFAGLINSTHATICGALPMLLFLGILDRLDPEKNIRGTIAGEFNSGELTGDYSCAVGYESIYFAGSK